MPLLINVFSTDPQWCIFKNKQCAYTKMHILKNAHFVYIRIFFYFLRTPYMSTGDFSPRQQMYVYGF